jgi:peptidoglycan/LPS O-acetylase OafA/YrhL
MRLPQLDYLRGMAVLLVLGRHFDPLPTDLGWAARPFEAWLRCGWVGVDLFFVLSGFLVSGLLMSEYRSSGGVRVGRFLLRRGFKIYPAFYILLAVTALFSVARGRTPAAIPFLCEALYVQNYGQAVWQHTWTLAVEEHFYLTLGLVAAIMAAIPAFRRPQVLVGGCVVGMGGALVARVLTWELGNRDPGWYYSTHLRFDAFLAGVLLSYLYQYHRESVVRRVGGCRVWVALGGLALVSPCLAYDVAHPAMLTVGFTALYLGFALVLLAALTGTHDRRRSGRLGLIFAPLALIGFHSYSIYLWHIPIRRWLSPAVNRLAGGPLPGPWELALYLAGSVVVGYLMAKLVELPFLQIRDRYFPSTVQGPLIVEKAKPAAPPTPARHSASVAMASPALEVG